MHKNYNKKELEKNLINKKCRGMSLIALFERKKVEYFAKGVAALLMGRLDSDIMIKLIQLVAHLILKSRQ